MALVFAWAVMEATAFDLSEVYQVPAVRPHCPWEEAQGGQLSGFPEARLEACHGLS